ncbi:hypothetical protein XENORESO_010208 [Xenotaenia resolanae]|uniref:Uncharacterized protein n=1 Tax=Xenotaenia resolanae TaxID=208358 RepID=A0ABV0X1W4_9TELE
MFGQPPTPPSSLRCDIHKPRSKTGELGEAAVYLASPNHLFLICTHLTCVDQKQKQPDLFSFSKIKFEFYRNKTAVMRSGNLPFLQVINFSASSSCSLSRVHSSGWDRPD